MQADIAISTSKLQESFPFSPLKGGANVLIFPTWHGATLHCELLTKIGGAESIGPILSGMAKPVHLLQRGVEVEDIVNIATIAVVDAQEADVPVLAKAARAAVTVG